MSNKGRITNPLQESTVQEVLGLIAEIDAKLPFLLRLSTEEKQHLAKPRPSTKLVVESLADLQVEAGIPLAPDDPMLEDLSVYLGLTQVLDVLADTVRRLEDTRLQAGSEAWSEGLVRYGMLRQMSRSKPELLSVLDRVGPLIARRGTRSSTPSEPEAPSEAEAPTPAR